MYRIYCTVMRLNVMYAPYTAHLCTVMYYDTSVHVPLTSSVTTTIQDTICSVQSPTDSRQYTEYTAQ